MPSSDEQFTVGPCRGTLHDGCFIEVESDEHELRIALVHASLTLHGRYLRLPPNPAWAEAVAGDWSDGTVLRFRSIPAERIIQIKRFPKGTGWCARLWAPTESLVAGAA